VQVVFRKLDSLLRGGETAALPLVLSLQLIVGLGAIYGACMGLFAVSGGGSAGWLQALASSAKLPALFLLTLLVTFPALYVFSVLSGSPLRFIAVLRLLLASIVVMVAVSASFAPILAFFTLSTSSYPFVVLLNVVLLGIAGTIGLGFLRRTLGHLMTAIGDIVPPNPAPDAASEEASAAPAPRVPSSDNGRSVGIFRIWLFIFALVGAQMGWLLRPFIGRPELAFTLFRPRTGNFFQAAFEHFLRLFGA
jgi:hypothetical protein